MSETKFEVGQRVTGAATSILDDDAKQARIAELQSERSAHVWQLVEIDRELAQFGERPGFDAFKTTVAGYMVAILLDERMPQVTSRSVREDVALVFQNAAAWMRRPGELT